MKKVLALLLSGVITASVFAGCSSSPSESSSSSAADTSATEQTEPQTTVQPLADSVKKQLDEAIDGVEETVIIHALTDEERTRREIDALQELEDKINAKNNKDASKG